MIFYVYKSNLGEYSGVSQSMESIARAYAKDIRAGLGVVIALDAEQGTVVTLTEDDLPEVVPVLVPLATEPAFVPTVDPMSLTDPLAIHAIAEQDEEAKALQALRS